MVADAALLEPSDSPKSRETALSRLLDEAFSN